MDNKLIFFSYNRDESELALKLAADLISNNLNPWVDQINIRAGERWDQAVENALKSATYFLIILSPASVVSQNVLDEISFALNKQKKIIPVLSAPCEIPFRLERFQYIDFTKNYSAAFAKLLKEFDIPDEKHVINPEKPNSLIKKYILVSAIVLVCIIVGYMLWQNRKTNNISSNTSGVDTTSIIQKPTNSQTGNTGVEKYDSINKPKPFASNKDRERVFGKFKWVANPLPGNPDNIIVLDNWVEKNIVKVAVPQLRPVIGIDSVLFNKKYGRNLQQAFIEIQQKGLLNLVLTWDGSFVSKLVRGSKTILSNHSFGTAFDINTRWNLLGMQPAPKGSKGSVYELVPIFEKYGFYWGGNSARKDGQHFEIGDTSR